MCAAIPVVGQIEAVVSNAERARLRALAERQLANDPALPSITHFGSRVQVGSGPGPALLIDDASEIWLAKSPEERLLEYRLALLGQTNDILVISGGRSPDFEAYISSLLGIGPLDVVIAANPDPRKRSPMPRRCAENERILRHLTERARKAGGMSIVPFMGTGNVWSLAGKIAEVSKTRVYVAAPPPGLSRQVNNKLWFAGLVREVFGAMSLPRTSSAYGPAALAFRVHELSQGCARLAIKAPDSAGSAGTLVLAAEGLRHLHLADLRQRMIDLLKSIGSDSHFPLKVEVWESPIVSSPSVQTWIPHKTDGPPVVEGLFEQIVEGDVGEFVGATRINLPRQWQDRLAHEAFALAIFFQELGYFGRCSFDAIVAGNTPDDAKLHWVECNGRWGGVSIPMTLLNRLVRPASTPEIVIVQRTELDFPATPFRKILRRLKDLLFRPGQSTEGVILLTPQGMERGTAAHFMALAVSFERAREIAGQTLNRITSGTDSE